MAERIRTDSARTTMVCVDAYDQGILSGRFYNYGQDSEAHPFRGVMQLLTGMEQLLDSVNFPQSFTAVRSFASAADTRRSVASENQYKKGKKATFVVKILFRQHTSWQGSVTWLEEGAEQPFRSVLELLLLIDSALNEAP